MAIEPSFGQMRALHGRAHILFNLSQYMDSHNIQFISRKKKKTVFVAADSLNAKFTQTIFVYLSVYCPPIRPYRIYNREKKKYSLMRWYNVRLSHFVFIQWKAKKTNPFSYASLSTECQFYFIIVVSDGVGVRGNIDFWCHRIGCASFLSSSFSERQQSPHGARTYTKYGHWNWSASLVNPFTTHPLSPYIHLQTHQRSIFNNRSH